MTAKTWWLTVSLALAPVPALAYETTFPLRGDSLPEGVYLRSAGHGTQYGYGAWAIDFGAASWENNGWVDGNGDGTNEGRHIFGAPLYAPEDGWIVACWNDIPEKASPADNYDFDGDGIDDPSPFGSGNHVNLMNADGTYMTLFAHLQHGSVPAALCPMPASRDLLDPYSVPGTVLNAPDGWPDDLVQPNCAAGSGWAAHARGTVLPTPVWVEKGTHIGNIGHTGRSGGPHLHMHIRPVDEDPSGHLCVGPYEEPVFTESFSAECGSADVSGWTPLDGDTPLEPFERDGNTCDDDSDCTPGFQCLGQEPEDVLDGICAIPEPAQCFFTDPIGPEADQFDTNVPATDIQLVTDVDGATVVYQNAGNLRIRSYAIDGHGQFSLTGTRSDGAVNDLAAAVPRSSSRDVVVSIRGTNDLLKHIPYSVTSTGITRMNGQELTEGTIDQVVSVRSPTHSGFVVAVKNNQGNLQVMDYDVDASLNIVRQQPTGYGSAINDVDIVPVSVGFDGVVTAELTSANLLVLRTFAVPVGGGVTADDTELTLVGGTSVRVTNVPTFFHEYVVTSVIQNDDTLRLDSWEIESDGDIVWIDTQSAGETRAQDSVGVGWGDIVTGVRDASDQLRLIGWSVDEDGQLRRSSTRVDLGAMTSGAVGHFEDYVIAARSDGGGQLVLTSWEENFDISH